MVIWLKRVVFSSFGKAKIRKNKKKINRENLKFQSTSNVWCDNNTAMQKWHFGREQHQMDPARIWAKLTLLAEMLSGHTISFIAALYGALKNG